MSVGSSVSPTPRQVAVPPTMPVPGQVTPHSAWTHLDTAVGRLLLTTDGASLTGVWFERHRDGGDHRPSALQRAGVREDDHPVLAAARSQLEEYFARERRGVDPPLASAGAGVPPRGWGGLRRTPPRAPPPPRP